MNKENKSKIKHDNSKSEDERIPDYFSAANEEKRKENKSKLVKKAKMLDLGLNMVLDGMLDGLDVLDVMLDVPD